MKCTQWPGDAPEEAGVNRRSKVSLEQPFPVKPSLAITTLPLALQNCSEGVAGLKSKLFLPSGLCPAQPLWLLHLHLSKIRLWMLLGMVRGGLCSKGRIPSLPLRMALTRQCHAQGWGSGKLEDAGTPVMGQITAWGRMGFDLGPELCQTLSGVTGCIIAKVSLVKWGI